LLPVFTFVADSDSRYDTCVIISTTIAAVAVIVAIVVLIVSVAVCIVSRGKKETAAFSRVPKSSWSADFFFVLNYVMNFREDNVVFIARNERTHFKTMETNEGETATTFHLPSSPASKTVYNPPPAVSQFTEPQWQPLSTPPAPYPGIVQHTQ